MRTEKKLTTAMRNNHTARPGPQHYTLSRPGRAVSLIKTRRSAWQNGAFTYIAENQNLSHKAGLAVPTKKKNHYESDVTRQGPPPKRDTGRAKKSVRSRLTPAAHGNYAYPSGHGRPPARAGLREPQEADYLTTTVLLVPSEYLTMLRPFCGALRRTPLTL